MNGVIFYFLSVAFEKFSGDIGVVNYSSFLYIAISLLCGTTNAPSKPLENANTQLFSYLT